jgi:phosphoenolpyruvate-protein kinase (PTS system EI component)
VTTETTEHRVSRLEGAYDQIDKRLTEQRQNTESQFGELGEEIRGLRTEMREDNQELRGEIHGLRTEVNARFDRVTNVMIGGIIAVVGAVTASIVVNLINS